MKINYLHYILMLFAASLYAQNPSQVGEWSEPIVFDIVPVAAANLPNGKLIVWSSKYKDTYGGADGSTYTQIFDPFQGVDGVAEQSTESNTNHDMFCPGINNLPDGRILAAGGSSSEKTSLYDYQTGLWSVADNMNVPRGYQGNVTLSDGSVFTIGGSWAGERGGKSAEIWTPNTGWISIPSLQGELLTDGNNPNLDDPDPSQRIYRTDNHAWLIPAPNGKIFHAGPGTNMHWIDVNDINNPQVQDLGSRLDDVYSMNGNAAMFDIGKVLKTGGSRTYSMGAPASDLSYVIDINSETPLVTKVPGLNEARAMHNTTVLPDGTILITGGLDSGSVFTDEGASYAGELFDPTTNSWSDTAAMQEARTYHSVAILMQDGRVFVGGGGLCAGPVPDCVNHFSAEIYSPAYLFNTNGTLATRPTISAPASADYNSQITVTGSTNISEFSLVRFSSATHSTNNEQRRIPVSFTSSAGNYTVSVPNRELLPPGIYMLFAIDNNGIPSIAESIKIGTVIPIEDNPNLVLDLRFEEGTGSTIQDFSIYNNNATIVERDNNANPVSLTQNYWSPNGFDGGALEMDGSEHNSNTLVEVPYSSSLGSTSNEITVMAWVYRDEIEFNGSILTNDYPDLFFGFHNSLYKWAFPTTDGNHVRLFSGYTPPETWLHMAATYDGNIARLYANGVEINSGYISGEITYETVEQYFSSFTTSGFYDRRIIGNESGITDEVDGKIDELKVFNKAHRPEVIEHYYKLGLELYTSLYDCTAENIIAQYKIGVNGDWIDGDYVEAAEGVEVYIRAVTTNNKEYMVTLPVVDGPTFSSINDLPNFEDPTAYKIDSYSGDGLIEVENTGTYVFTTVDGCAKTIYVKAIVEQTCDDHTQEYKINGVWLSGEEVINVNQGDEVIVSALPNIDGLKITLPDGTQVDDNFNLGNVDFSDAGFYTLTSIYGCEINLQIIVNGMPPLPCEGDANFLPEYIINGVSESGLEEITVTEGDALIIGINQDVLFAITLPDGTTVVGDHDLGNVSSAQSGLYTFESDLGCIKTLDITVNELDPICVSSPMDVEYIINNVSGTGLENISLNTGDQLMLSILQTNGFTITLPDNTDVVGDYDLGTVTTTQSGVYTFESDLGCIKTLNVNIVDGSVCAANPLTQEYKINGVWQSGSDVINVNQGDEVILSALPNDVDLTITLPDGSQVGDNYSLGDVVVAQSGVYTIESEFGCIITLNINIDDPNANPCIINPMDVEYIINSISGSSSEQIAINEGDQLILSTVQGSTGFTITLPDNSDVVGDYDLGTVTLSQSGLYTFESDLGCIKTLDITVNELDPICVSNPMDIEYIINNISNSGLESISLNEGDELILSIIQSGDFTITLPDNTDVIGDYDLGSVVIAQSGLYTFESDLGCIKTLDITIIDGSACTVNPLTQEYKINGVWQSGADIINVNQGDEVILSALPNGVDLTITLPDGSEVGDDYSLGDVVVSQSGVYTIESEFGCIITLNINVDDPNANPCTINPMDVEYIINSISGSISGSSSEQIAINEGDQLILSTVQGSTGFTITLPDNSDVVGDYDLGTVTLSQSGLYTFESDLGCIKTLDITVDELDPICVSNPMDIEYIINNISDSGLESISLNEGDELILSIIQSGDFTITLPDNTDVIGDYDLGSVVIAQSGLYTFESDLGCIKTLDITIIDGSACTVNPLTQEYKINGVWQSGADIINVDEGDEVILSALPNEVGITITLPDGSQVGDNYSLGDVVIAQSGIYTIESEFGCIITLDVNVDDPNANPACVNNPMDIEYIVNGASGSGLDQITINDGDGLLLSTIQGSIGFTITLPDNTDIVGDYDLGNVTPTQSGLYTFESDLGCIKTLNIIIVDDAACLINPLTQEYKINGVWQNGSAVINVNQGDEVILSALPNGVGITTTLPDGSQVGDNFNLGDVVLSQAGIYTIESEFGCIITLDININDPNAPSKINATKDSSSTLSLQYSGKTDSLLKVVPNPAHAFIDVYGYKSSKIEIINVLGITLKTINNTESRKTRINLKDIPNGVYLLRNTINNRVETKRIVIQ